MAKGKLPARPSVRLRFGFIMVVLAVLAMSVIRQNRLESEVSAQLQPASIPESPVSQDAGVAATPEPEPAADPATTGLGLQQLAAECLTPLSTRYPRGRLLKVQVNTRAEICNAIIETDVDSGRFFGVQRRYRSGDFQQLGEVRLPDSVLAAGPLPSQLLRWDALLAKEVQALPGELIASDRQSAALPWALQLVWMQPPLDRAVWMLGYDFEDTFYWAMDVADDDQATQVMAAMPSLAEDLEDPTASPDALADRSADKIAAVALEGGGAAAGTVYASAQWCADALGEYNVGARVLRVAISPDHCSLLLETSGYDGNWTVLRFTGFRVFTEQGRVVVPSEYEPLPNYTIDPAWVGAQALQERLQRSGIGDTPEFIGIAWDPVGREVFWQVRPQQLERSEAVPLQFDRAGKPVRARFPQLVGDAFGAATAPVFVSAQ